MADLARCLRAGVPEHAPGAIAAHVLDTMLGIREAAETGEPVAIASTVTRPEPLDPSFDPSVATL